MSIGQEEPDEAELLARSIRQDHHAFTVLVERHTGPIFNLVARMVGGASDAEDLAQETFIAAFKALPAFRAEAKFSTWLYRIAVNKCRDWLRARQAAPLQQDEERDHQSHERAIDPRTPEQDLSRKQMAEHLELAIAALPPLYREAFILKHIDGLNYEDMSDILNVSRDTLKMRVYKARIRLYRDLVGPQRRRVAKSLKD